MYAQFHDFPGAKAGFTNKLEYVPEAPEEPVPCFRILDEYGRRIKGSDIPQVSRCYNGIEVFLVILADCHFCVVYIFLFRQIKALWVCGGCGVDG